MFPEIAPAVQEIVPEDPEADPEFLDTALEVLEIAQYRVTGIVEALETVLEELGTDRLVAELLDIVRQEVKRVLQTTGTSRHLQEIQ